MAKVFLIIIVFSFSVLSSLYSQEKDVQKTEPEYNLSLYLIDEAWNFLDVYSDSIWSDWNNYKDETVFIGAPHYFDLFINPYKEIPSGFDKLPYTVHNKEIYYRDSSHIDRATNTTFVTIDSTYFRLVRMAPYSPEFCNRFYNYCKKTHFKNSVLLTGFEEYIYSYEHWIRTFIHESFHIYQLKSKKTFRLQSPVDFKRKKQAILSYIEGQLLLKSIEASTDEELYKYVYQFLAVRDKRFKSLPFWQENYEKESEWLEGCATYVDYKTIKHLTSHNHQLVVLKSDKRFSGEFSCTINYDEFYKTALDVHSRRFDNVNGKEYFYGWAITLLLDKLCGDKWKVEIIEKDVYPDDLLLKYSGYEKSQRKKFLKQVNLDFNYSMLEKSVKELLRNDNYYILD